MKLEICTPTIQSALNAQIGGAHRIELCANLREGGTTPSAATILACKKQLSIPTFVLIRERGGDFSYSDIELEVMINDIIFCRENGVDGVVIGALTSDRKIHVEHTQAMMAAAGNMSVTFHRAFDRVEEPYEALETLKKMGVHRILTSGTKNTAPEGVYILKKLIQQAENQLTILVGSGVTPENIPFLIKETNCQELHFSAKKTIRSPFGEEYWESDVVEIQKAVNLII